METNMLQDRIRGSLIAGAIGDALGYPVEFLSIREIRKRYGDRGITRLDTKHFWNNDFDSPKAVVSDDTQMTLFTAMGLLNAAFLKLSPKESICKAYLEWYHTQISSEMQESDSWIMTVPELYVQRAPGNTCMSALSCIKSGEQPHNNSKGCGGVMRIAPVPLFALSGHRMSIEESDRLAGDASEITHLHPLGFIPSALMAHVIYRLAEDSQPSASKLRIYIHEGFDTLRRIYPSYTLYIEELQNLVKMAINVTQNELDDATNIETIGGGWTGDDAIAIALYCAIKYFDNIEQALIAAVNHSGDSDSTGAVTGNILGAALGYDAIPQHFKDNVEFHYVILKVADQLCETEA